MVYYRNSFTFTLLFTVFTSVASRRRTFLCFRSSIAARLHSRRLAMAFSRSAIQAVRPHVTIGIPTGSKPMCGSAVATAPHFNLLNAKFLRPFFLHRKMSLPKTPVNIYIYIYIYMVPHHWAHLCIRGPHCENETILNSYAVFSEVRCRNRYMQRQPCS
jgi:hypothetical protein